MSDECADTPIVESVHFVECAYQRITESERCHKETFLKQRDSIVGKAIALLYLLERCCKINKIPPKRTHFHAVFFHFGATEAGCRGLTARHGTGGNGKRKSLLAAHFHSDMHDKEALSDRNVRMQPSHIPFLLFYFFTFLLFKRSLLCIINKACLHCKQGFFALQTRLLFKPGYARWLTHWVRASYKTINICGRAPTSGAASWVSTRGNGSLCSSRFLPRRSRRTSPIALPCCRRLRGRCPGLPALPL